MRREKGSEAGCEGGRVERRAEERRETTTGGTYCVGSWAARAERRTQAQGILRGHHRSLCWRVVARAAAHDARTPRERGRDRR